MIKTVLAATAALLFTASMASALSLTDPICQQAVSLEACAAHVAYSHTLHDYVDTSPLYMKQIDPRVNKTLTYAGDGGAGAAGSAGASSGSGK